LTVRNRLNFGGKKVLLQVGNEKEGDQKIPDAEMGLRGQGILLVLGVPGAEEGTKLIFQLFQRCFLSIGWHASSCIGNNIILKRMIVCGFEGNKGEAP
jgi:hypothetical protein